ncbi:protein PAM68, chloroplastic [Oryza brachyantha]|uniref:protein PAM68, chloroplastic n=1 Tax=Oryza brachyantha TaxID=4533 RepID=UPI001ADCA8B9|nr:protein PAM68, chloroplastic [Oryza brachyantha]
MAAVLHQTALQPPQTTTRPHLWTHNPMANLSPPHVALPKRRRAPLRRLHAAGSGGAIGSSAVTDTETATTKPPSKKTSRKEKQRMRRQEKEQEQKQMLLESLAVKNGGEGGEEDDDELPQPVFDRILRRIMFMVGVPMASGVGLLNLYGALERDQGVAVPFWLPLLTILFAFGTSALGIAFGTLSASWDPEKEGSLLGLEEARANWPVLWKEEIEKANKKK